MRKITKALLALVAVVLMSSNALATEIGVFSLPEITAQSDVAKAVNKDLESKFGKETKALEADIKDFQKDMQEFQKQAAALSEKARNDKAKKIETEGRKIEERRVALAQKVAPRQQAIQQEMLDILGEACKEYAKDEKLDLILNGASMVAFVNDATDITPELIKEMNKIWKSRGSKFKK